jgi:hypothetical protein
MPRFEESYAAALMHEAELGCGYRIIVIPQWEQVVDKTITHRIPAHWFVCWLAKWLPITPYVEIREVTYKDADPYMSDSLGCIWCSPKQRDTLVKAVAARRELPPEPIVEVKSTQAATMKIDYLFDDRYAHRWFNDELPRMTPPWMLERALQVLRPRKHESIVNLEGIT